MITIELKNATNGIIKTVIDTQYNGVDEPIELTTVYELDEDDPVEYFLKIIEFFDNISADLALNLGSDDDKTTLSFDIDWGDRYNPTEEEINRKIKYLQSKIKDLKSLKKS